MELGTNLQKGTQVERGTPVMKPLFLLASLFAALPAALTADDFCASTSQKAFESCEHAADGDLALALAKCINVSDPAARDACTAQAWTDFRDARQTCRDLYQARQAACRKLGPDRYDPIINPGNFVSQITNRYFPLTPGTALIYEGGGEHVDFFVTYNTRVILGVTCVEVHDTVTNSAGEVIEDTRDWFAQDKQGNVWYFGENSQEIEGGLVVSLQGSWTGGVDGAKPGIVMKGAPRAHDFYRQEFLLEEAEDLAEVLSVSARRSFGSQSVENCVETAETSSIEPDALEQKFYAPNIGQVLTIDVRTNQQIPLVRHCK